jgi:uncharacterized protein (DUF305 family)
MARPPDHAGPEIDDRPTDEGPLDGSTVGETDDDVLDESDWFADDALVAPADAIPLGDAGAGPPPEEHDAPGGRRGPSWAQILVLAVAIGFLGGAVGYVIGKGRPPADDSVDVGFLQDMIDHHEQGIEIAREVLRKDRLGEGGAASPVVRGLAEEVILIQEREVGLMDAQLDLWGKPRGDLDRRAMTWMGMDTTVDTMPGMQSAEALAELDAATGSEADRLFLTMMRDHHQGGVHMANDAARHADSGRVQELAERIGRSQSSEIAEYTGILEQLGLGS